MSAALSPSSGVILHKTLQELGSKVVSIDYKPQGICLGLVTTGSLAFLSFEEELFNGRIDKIIEVNHSVMKNKIAHLKKEKEISIFFQNVFVYQIPVHFSDIFDRDLLVEGVSYFDQLECFSHIVNLMGSITLDKLGGASSKTTHPFFIDATDLHNILITLDESLEEFEGRAVIGFILTNHIISIGYDGNGCSWFLIDADHMPIQEALDFDEIYEAILTGIFGEEFDLDDIENQVSIKLHFLFLRREKTAIDKITDKILQDSSLSEILDVDKESILHDRASYALNVLHHESERYCLSIIEKCKDSIDELLANKEEILQIVLLRGLDQVLDRLLTLKKDLLQSLPDFYQYFLFSLSTPQRGCFDVFIKHGADIHAKNENDENGIWVGSHYGKIDRVRTLIELGVDHSLANKKGISPLSKAVAMGHFDLAKFLLENGAELNPSGENDLPPLFFAIRHKREEFFWYLVEQGADIDIIPPRLGSYLILALKMQQWSLAKKLILRTSDLNLHNQTQQTAMELAIYFRYRDIVKMLLDRGVLVSQVTSKGKSFKHLARRIGDKEIIHYLRYGTGRA